MRLFGHVALEVDGKPFALATPRRSLSILVYVLLNRGVAVQRDYLAFSLWPDEEEDAARQKLRASLHELQKVLPPSPAPWIAVESESLRWQATGVTLDTERFTALGAAGELEPAVALYAGDLLPALYEEWLDEPRERLRAQYVDYCDRLAANARAGRDFARAIAFAQRILAVDPWREDIVRRMLAMRYESGDAAGALAEYERFAKRLREEMDVEPMPETRAVRDAIAAARDLATPASAGAAAPPPDTDAGVLPFFGRDAERRALTAAWTAASAGRARIVFLSGESGIGKSRLALEFAHTASDRGGRTLRGATGEPELVPYQAFADALRSAMPLLAAARLDGATAATLSILIPELRAHVAALPDLPDLTPEAERARLFEAVARAIEALAKPRPLLFVLEDLHAARESTLALLGFVLQRCASSRVLVVATFRETERSPAFSEVRRRAESLGIASDVVLGPLQRSDVAPLQALHPGLSVEALDSAFARSAGNPLFLSALVSDATPDGGSASFEALLNARLDGLSDETRTVAEVAAMLGRRFPAGMLAPAIGWDDAEIRAALDDLIEHRLVRETAGRGLFDYAFSHQAIADALTSGAPRARDRERHRRIARALERTFVADLEELASTVARHYDAAGEASFAAPHHLNATRRAVALGALGEARSYAERCLAGTANPLLRAQARLELDAIFARAGDLESRAQGLAALEALLDELGDAGLACETAERRAGLAHDAGDRQAERAALAAMRERAELAGDPRWLAVADLALANAYGAPVDELARAAERAVAGFAEAGDDEGRARAWLALAELSARLLDRERACGAFERGEALALAMPEYAARIARARAAYALAPFRFDLVASEAEARAWMALAEAAGDRFEAAHASEALAAVLASSSRLSEALALARAAADFFEEHGARAPLARARATLARTLARAGALPQAKAAATSAASDTIPALRAQSLVAYAIAAALSGDAAADEAAETARELYASARDARGEAEAAAASGEAAYARGDFAGAAALFERAAAAFAAASAIGPVANARAMQAASLLGAGRTDDAAATIELVARDRAWRSWDTPWPERIDWVTALIRRAASTGDAAASVDAARERMERDARSLDRATGERYGELWWNRALREELGLGHVAGPQPDEVVDLG